MLSLFFLLFFLLFLLFYLLLLHRRFLLVSFNLTKVNFYSFYIVESASQNETRKKVVILMQKKIEKLNIHIQQITFIFECLYVCARDFFFVVSCLISRSQFKIEFYGLFFLFDFAYVSPSICILSYQQPNVRQRRYPATKFTCTIQSLSILFFCSRVGVPASSRMYVKTTNANYIISWIQNALQIMGD